MYNIMFTIIVLHCVLLTIFCRVQKRLNVPKHSAKVDHVVIGVGLEGTLWGEGKEKCIKSHETLILSYLQVDHLLLREMYTCLQLVD